MPKKKQRPEYPMVAVRAFDWAGPESTVENFTLADCREFGPIEAWICGFLVDEDKDRLIIAQQHFYEEGHHRCPVAISKATIRDRIDYKP